MTLSYLAVSVFAVVVVELLAVGIVLPPLFAEQELTNRVQVAALKLAKDVTGANVRAERGGLQLPDDFQLGSETATSKPNVVTYSADSVDIPKLKGTDLASNSPFEMVVDADGLVVASSWPDR